MKSIERSHYLSCTDDAMSKYVWLLDNYNYLQNQPMYGSVYLLKMFTIFIYCLIHIDKYTYPKKYIFLVPVCLL